MRRARADEREADAAGTPAATQDRAPDPPHGAETPQTALLGLQASAGNAAIGRLIAGAAPSGGTFGALQQVRAISIQRCPGCGGTCGCDEREKSAELSALLAAPSEPETELIQRTPAGIAARIESARGGGAPLDPAVQNRLERGLGSDLSSVRVHTDGGADLLARQLGATAFTTGRDIFFRRGAHDPSSAVAMRTIAHEAAHVVQQARGPVNGKSFGSLRISEPDDGFEREADEAAARIVEGSRSHGPRPPPPARTSVSLQRVCQCGGTCGKCGDALEEEEDELALQRLPQPAAEATIQLLRDPLGSSLVVDWLPSAKLDFARSDGTTGSLAAAFGDTDTATIPDVPRDVTGDLTFPVVANWHSGSGPGPGPNPPQKCDACSALQRAAVQSVAGFVERVLDQLPFPANLIVPTIASRVVAAVSGLVGKAIDILPKELVQKCRDTPIDELIAQVAALKTAADLQDCSLFPDFCKIADTITRTIGRLKIPIIGPLLQLFIGSIKEKVFKALSDALAAVLKELLRARKACGLSGPPVPVVGGKGTATSTMRVHVLVGPDGAMQVQGPGPQVSSSGSGATLVVPVDSSKNGSAAGALVAQVPMIRSTGTDGSIVSHQFTVNVNLTAPPQARKIDCPVEKFGAFKVASDKFEQEDKEETHIHHWFFGLEPRVRDVLHTGQAILKVTGRASRTGSVDFNLKLGEKRAKRVESILQDFAGSDSHMRSFSLGLLGTEEPGEVGSERRVDVEIEGEIPGEQATKIKEPLCSGHLGEKSDEGPPVPITQPDEIPITGVPAPALEPALVGAGLDGAGPEAAPELEAAGPTGPELELAEPSAGGALGGVLAEAEQAPEPTDGFFGGLGQGIEEILGGGAGAPEPELVGVGAGPAEENGFELD
jgi:hypothetical protein